MVDIPGSCRRWLLYRPGERVSLHRAWKTQARRVRPGACGPGSQRLPASAPEIRSVCGLEVSRRVWADSGLLHGVFHAVVSPGCVLDRCSGDRLLGMSHTAETSHHCSPWGVWPEAPPSGFPRDAGLWRGAWDPPPLPYPPARGRPEWERDPVMCLLEHWHNNRPFLPLLLTARIILLSLLEAGGPVLVTCPFLAGSCPVILGEC